jgi:hypothetical protein
LGEYHRDTRGEQASKSACELILPEYDHRRAGQMRERVALDQCTSSAVRRRPESGSTSAALPDGRPAGRHP